MRQYGIKAGTVKWRALLIIGALISLCLSDTVGPRLLPLPVSEVVTTAAVEGPLGQSGEEARSEYSDRASRYKTKPAHKMGA
jgi:hypothetical protein